MDKSNVPKLKDRYESFKDFMEDLVLPHYLANPNDHRLDGWASGGNRECFGKFRHNGKTWVVHADTRYDPLMIAYSVLADGKGPSPFEMEKTPRGMALILVPELRKRQKSRFKHLYIYQER